METCGKGDPCITHSMTLIGIREIEQGIAQFVGVGVDQKAIDPIFHGMDCPPPIARRSPVCHRQRPQGRQFRSLPLTATRRPLPEADDSA
jgi:hypothetical protein